MRNALWMLFAMICLTGRLLAQDFIGLYQHDGAGIAAVLDSPPEYAIQVDVLYQTAAGDTFADVAVVTSEGAFVGLNKVTGLAALKVSLVVTLFDPESDEVIAYGVLAPLDADTPPKPSMNFPGDLCVGQGPRPRVCVERRSRIGAWGLAGDLVQQGHGRESLE